MTRFLGLILCLTILAFSPSVLAENEKADCEKAVDHIYELAMQEARASQAEVVAGLPENQREEANQAFENTIESIKLQFGAQREEAIKECMLQEEPVSMACILEAKTVEGAAKCEADNRKAVEEGQQEQPQPNLPEPTARQKTQCEGAVDHMLKIALEEIGKQLEEPQKSELREMMQSKRGEAIEECLRKLGEVDLDCIMAASDLEALTQCKGAE